MADNISVGIGLSIEHDTDKAVKEAVQQAKSALPKEKIDLAVVFSSVDFAHPHAIKTISNLLRPVPLIGCSGAGVISNNGIFRNGLGIMLLSLPKTISFNTAFVKGVRLKTALKAGDELGQKLLSGFQGARRDLGIIFSDGLLQESSGIVYGLQERLGRSFPVLGALASDNLRYLKTYVYFNQELANDAVCGIIFGGKLNFAWGRKHGWKPLGKPHRVTRATGNIVYEIDNSPAASVYEEYVGAGLGRLKKNLKRLSIFYPLGIQIAEEEEYMLRNIRSIEGDGALIFQGDVPQDSIIRLMIGTKESCLSATHQAIEEAKKGLAQKKMDFAFIFDSVSRCILLGRDANKELEIIKEGLGSDTPLLGVYTYGEEAPLKGTNYRGKTYFHSQTVTILGFQG